MRSENESDKMDNIPQFPNMNVDCFFTRAFNSFGVIKGEQFQVQQNDESDDSDTDLIQIVKTLRDEFLKTLYSMMPRQKQKQKHNIYDILKYIKIRLK